jgi:Fe-S cluster biogenesis protein NfuA
MLDQDRVALISKVQNVIEQIRPYLQKDGGDVEFINITDDNVVEVQLMGACGACPYSLMTLKGGIESAMVKAIPEIKAVEAVNL